MIGVVPFDDGLQKAKDVGLDLVEKKQKRIQIKEIKFRPVTEENDYQIKVNKIKSFLVDGNKAKVTLRFRGREMGHRELGAKLFDKIQEETKQIASADQKPKMFGRQLVMVLNFSN